MAQTQPSVFDIGGSGAPLGALRDASRNFTALGAMPVKLPMRKNIGLLNLSWANIIVVTLAMLALQWGSNLRFNLFAMLLGGGVIYGDDASLRNFAFLWAALAIFERFRRLAEEKRGVEPHNFWQGDSRFGFAEFLPLRPKIIAIAVEPGLTFLTGAVMRRLGFGALGWVIILSSVCFAVSEWRLSRQMIDRRRVRRDTDKEAQWEAELANEGTGRSEKNDNGEPLSTGIGGLEAEIRNRARETAEGGAL